ncbi:MAG: Uma2 family endonuclease [Chloroflexota bacterium]|nr:Uma2 family endonuclease [Chloroflexota bacterium]
MTPAEYPAEVKTHTRPAVTLRPLVHYPESDGEPMAETDVHRDQLIDLLTALKDHFRNDPQVYVAGNLLLYYEEGNPQASVAPDVFVVKGVPKGDRRIYKLWEEGQAPDVVFEITSASTRLQDLGPKKGLYEVLDVEEYFLFDPLEEYLAPPLMGYRLGEKGYRLVEERPLLSQVLGLELRVEEGRLRLYDRPTGRRLPTPAEEAEARRAAEARAAQEAEARRAAEAEVARLREELSRLQAAS